MKSLIRTVLFSLIALPIAACGDREVSPPTEATQGAPVRARPAPVAEPKVTPPVAPVARAADAAVPVAPPVAVPTTYVEALALGTQLAAQWRPRARPGDARGRDQARPEEGRAPHRARAPVHRER